MKHKEQLRHILAGGRVAVKHDGRSFVYEDDDALSIISMSPPDRDIRMVPPLVRTYITFTTCRAHDGRCEHDLEDLVDLQDVVAKVELTCDPETGAVSMRRLDEQEQA